MIVLIATSFRTAFELFRTCSAPTLFGTQKHLCISAGHECCRQDRFELIWCTSMIDWSHLEFQH